MKNRLIKITLLLCTLTGMLSSVYGMEQKALAVAGSPSFWQKAKDLMPNNTQMSKFCSGSITTLSSAYLGYQASKSILEKAKQYPTTTALLTGGLFSAAVLTGYFRPSAYRFLYDLAEKGAPKIFKLMQNRYVALSVFSTNAILSFLKNKKSNPSITSTGSLMRPKESYSTLTSQMKTLLSNCETIDKCFNNVKYLHQSEINEPDYFEEFAKQLKTKFRSEVLENACKNCADNEYKELDLAIQDKSPLYESLSGNLGFGPQLNNINLVKNNLKCLILACDVKVLEMAADLRDVDMVQFILQHRPHHAKEYAPLVAAVTSRYAIENYVKIKTIVELLLKAGALPSTRHENGKNAIEAAKETLNKLTDIIKVQNEALEKLKLEEDIAAKKKTIKFYEEDKKAMIEIIKLLEQEDTK